MVKKVFAEILENGTKKSKNSRLRMKVIVKLRKVNSEKEKNLEKEKGEKDEI